ncbi:MAG TPA: hypothetical protein VJY36_05915 [Candidatus Bathyarchaeia archaeon]|nr:hypothetical protein [Candidatus Bathyarchaeia archaeon]
MENEHFTEIGEIKVISGRSLRLIGRIYARHFSKFWMKTILSHILRLSKDQKDLLHRVNTGGGLSRVQQDFPYQMLGSLFLNFWKKSISLTQ